MGINLNNRLLVERGIHHGEFLEMVGVVMWSGEKEGKETLTQCVT